jgi:hypothetical protein
MMSEEESSSEKDFLKPLQNQDAPDKSPFRGNRTPETKAILKPVYPKSDFCRARQSGVVSYFRCTGLAGCVSHSDNDQT